MNRLRELRKKKGLYQKDLSKILNISQGALSGYETGRYQPDPQMLQKLADYFSVSVDYLLEHRDGSLTESGQTRELFKIIEQDEYTINGKSISLLERERLIKIIEAVYWQPHEKSRN